MKEHVMNTVPVLNFLDFISVDGETLRTDTLKVAQVHKKRHDDILRLVRKRVAEAGDWGLRNFTEARYIDAQNGQSYPMFTMTREGYQFLVGKMSGAKAVKHQIAFIEAFKAMETYVRNQREGLRFRCMAKELECLDSARRGSFNGKGLNQRKQEKPILEAELAALMVEAQPALPLH